MSNEIDKKETVENRLGVSVDMILGIGIVSFF